MTMKKRITEDDDEEEVKREKPIWNEWGEEWVDEKDDESMPMMHVSIIKTLRQLLLVLCVISRLAAWVMMTSRLFNMIAHYKRKSFWCSFQASIFAYLCVYKK